MSFQVVGKAGVMRMLQQYTDPKLGKRLQQATKAGATVFKAPLKSEAGRVSKRMARAVSVRAARRDKPGATVTFRRKIAFFAHMVVGGTKAHTAKGGRLMVFKNKPVGVVARRVSGVKANDMVNRVASAHESQAYAAIDRDLDRTETK